MKKALLSLVFGALALLLNPSVKASSITLTGTASVAANLAGWTNVSIGQFDTSLGTLTKVTVTLQSALLQGSFSETAASSGVISAISASFTLRKNASLGLANATSYYIDTNNDDVVNTTPNWSSTTLTPNVKQSFTIYNTAYTSNQPLTLSGDYMGAYKGSGNVIFETKDTFSATVTAGTVTQDVTGVYAPVEISIEYDYNPVQPVPEPSTWAMLGMGSAGLVFLRRKLLKL